MPYFKKKNSYLILFLGHVGGCGITEEVSQWMENIQNSAVEETEPEELPKPMSSDKLSTVSSSLSSSSKIALNKGKNEKYLSQQQQRTQITTNNNNHSNHNYLPSKTYSSLSTPSASSLPSSSSTTSSASSSSSRLNQEDDFLYPYEKYSREANYRDITRNNNNTTEKSNDDWHSRSHERVRRASTSRPREDNKNTCSLYIQTDPLIWRHIREGIVDVSHKKLKNIKKKNYEKRNFLLY